MGFEDKLFKAIYEYEALFNEMPPTFGYEDAELYQLLLNCIKNKKELVPSDKVTKEMLDMDDDTILIT